MQVDLTFNLIMCFIFGLTIMLLLYALYIIRESVLLIHIYVKLYIHEKLQYI